MRSTIRINKLVKKLKEIGYQACAITDFGNLFGAIEFYQAMKKEGLQPIIGMVANVVPNIQFEQEVPSYQAHEITLLCQNKQGYRNLSYLASLGYTEGKFRGVPHISHYMLEEYSEGLIALSSGLTGEVGNCLLNGNTIADTIAQWYQDVFEGRYYFEIQNHGLSEQQKINSQLFILSKKLSIPLVGTNSCHYLSQNDAFSQHIWELIGEKKQLNANSSIQTDQRYLKSIKKMAFTFQDFPKEIIHNTSVIAEQCRLSLDNSHFYLPTFPTKTGENHNTLLSSKTKNGLEKRLKETYQIHAPQYPFEIFRQVYDERLEFELETIIQLQFSNYFLIVADYVNWMKLQEIPVGPGRGSSAGSLVAYALGITNVDPIHYNLCFERFINPERNDFPDFDIDFGNKERKRVFDYIRGKYGEKNVCQIAIFHRLEAKGILREVSKVLGFSDLEADKIAKRIPNKLGINLQESIQEELELALMEQKGTENEQRLIKLAKSLEGLCTTLGVHACGIVIFDRDVREIIPVCTSKKNITLSMFRMKYVEDQGGVKFDCLSLKTLSKMENILQRINQQGSPGSPLMLENIPLNDSGTFQLLCRGDTDGIFHVGSNGMKRLLRKIQPSKIEEIVSILALYRPGPLGSGMVDDFIQGRHNENQIVYLHPLLESVLNETYGVFIYQEQVMR